MSIEYPARHTNGSSYYSIFWSSKDQKAYLPASKVE